MANKKIELENKTGIPELDAIIQSTSNQFGYDLSGSDYGDYIPFSTNSIQLDFALKIGGFPIGRIIEIYGHESSLKTSFALQYIASKQKARLASGILNKRDLLLDLEHSLTHSFLENFGIDMSQTIWVRCETAEEALQMVINYSVSNAIDCVLIDSVDAMEKNAQLQRNIGDSLPGGVSKIMSESLRRLSKLTVQHNMTIFFINQIRKNIGVMYGNPNTTSGGNALKFYATVRLECLPRKPYPGTPDVTTFRVKITKTKLGGDNTGIIEIPFIIGKGVDRKLEIMEAARRIGVLKHSAGQTKVLWTLDSDPEPLTPDVERGKTGAEKALMENPELLEKVYQACMLHCNAGLVPPPEENSGDE